MNDIKLLTPDELESIQHLNRSTPYAIYNVSSGFFGIARHYGGMTYQSHHYTYVPAHDACIRDDVRKFLDKQRRKAKPKAQPLPQLEGLD
jgi:hypothetical protein